MTFCEDGVTVARHKVPYGHSTSGASHPWVHLVDRLELWWGHIWAGENIRTHWATWRCGRSSQRARLDARLVPEMLPCPDCFGLRERQPMHAVYYALRDGQIKIGTSIDPASRASGLGAVLLAWEAGDVLLEGFRHEQFRHLRVEGEWFRRDDALTEHIARLCR